MFCSLPAEIFSEPMVVISRTRCAGKIGMGVASRTTDMGERFGHAGMAIVLAENNQKMRFNEES
jgi:hypothetical protein